MKTNELIKIINRERDLYAKEVCDSINVYDANSKIVFAIPKDATSFFDITYYCMQPRYSLKKEECKSIEKPISEYLATRFERRSNPEDKYHLIVFEDNTVNYVESIENNMSGLAFKYGKQTVFTEKELDKLKRLYPYFSDMIDKIKVRI